MQIELIGTAILCDQPRAAADWFIEHFGFELGVDIDWYVNVQHPRHRNHSLDFLASEHGSLPEGLRGHTVGGTLLAFLVEDVEAEERRLRAAGQKVVLPLAREPWGQYRFQLAGPQGLFVEVLQRVPPDPQWLRDNDLAPE